MNNGWPNGIKDKIAPIKADRFFISKFSFNQYNNLRAKSLYTIYLDRLQKGAAQNLSKASLDFVSQ